MFGNQSTEYALNRPSKCLESCRNHRFLVGSCNVTTSTDRGGNELVILRHVEDVNEFVVDATFAVQSSIDVLSVCNYDSNLVVTSSHHPSTSTTTAVYRIPLLQDNHHNDDDDDDDDSVYSNRPRLLTDTSTRTTMEEELEHVMDLTTTSPSSIVSSIVWNPDCMPEENDDSNSINSTESTNGGSPSSNHHFATIQSNHVVHLYDLSRQDGCPIHTILTSSNTNQRRSFCLPKATWNPHDTNIIAMTNYTTQRIHTCDLR